MNDRLSGCKILIVDDTEANIDILVEALEEDYELSVATDGFAALECVELEKPDLILLDIMMPGMSGYEVCEKLKADSETSAIPIAFLSAISDAECKVRCFEAGAVDYITKPFEIIEVKARVKTHLSLELAKRELALKNDELERKVVERTNEICLTQDVTIEAIASLAEYRDTETGGHIYRTKNYVKLIAKRLQEKGKYLDSLSDGVIEMFYKSAPLHDIGKIAIRDEILLKPGKLTEEEFNEMKKHTTIGSEVLSVPLKKLGENSFLKYAMEFSKYHHEKWDGSGYPGGIKGEEIPISGRIMALADVYDALISERVYKPAFSHEEAVDIIKAESGKIGRAHV